MHFPRLPDWLIYAVVVLALLIAAIGRQERADAPPAPPPTTEAEGAALGPASPFDPAVVVQVADKTQAGAGTAFSISPAGVWVTARHVVEGCKSVAIVIQPGSGVAAIARIDPRGETAVLITRGGAPALPLAASLAASVSLAEIALWGATTVMVQLAVFRLADLVLHDLPKRIANGEMAAAALQVGAKIATALILAAAVSG